jgi:peptidoglycan/xylan/chitin deacetylase (PgdA/CDA1 family)
VFSPGRRSFTRHVKLTMLRIARWSGVSRVLLDSPWRRQRLLILCYHGTSLDDEHLWSGGLYIAPETLRLRLSYLKRARCNVLNLGEAAQLLYAGQLPPRSVVLTYDDGNYDFYARAFPLIHEFGFPVTVYWTTYYAEYNRPVFDVMLPYLLWKRQGSAMAIPEIGEASVRLDETGRQHAERSLKGYARRENLSAREKDALVGEVARRLGIDYEALCQRRFFSIMTSSEARELAAAGVDIQLHTHRHRTSRNPELFRREVEDNRRRVEAVSGRKAEHFCYPGGFILPEFPVWLRENRVTTATTCDPGLCSRETDAMLMPRLLDMTSLTMADFAGWVSGLAALLPVSRYAPAEGQLLEGDGAETARQSGTYDLG